MLFVVEASNLSLSCTNQNTNMVISNLL